MKEFFKAFFLIALLAGTFAFFKKYRVSVSVQAKGKKKTSLRWDMKDLQIGSGRPMSRNEKIVLRFENLYPETSNQRSCLDAALGGMRVGGKRRVVFPALPEANRKPGSTKNGPLVYNLELLSVGERPVEVAPKPRAKPKKKRRAAPRPKMNVIDFSGG